MKLGLDLGERHQRWYARCRSDTGTLPRYMRCITSATAASGPRRAQSGAAVHGLGFAGHGIDFVEYGIGLAVCRHGLATRALYHAVHGLFLAMYSLCLRVCSSGHAMLPRPRGAQPLTLCSAASLAPLELFVIGSLTRSETRLLELARQAALLGRPLLGLKRNEPNASVDRFLLGTARLFRIGMNAGNKLRLRPVSRRDGMQPSSRVCAGSAASLVVLCFGFACRSS